MGCVAEGQPQNPLLKDIGQGGGGRGERRHSRGWEATEEGEKQCEKFSAQDKRKKAFL